MSLSPGAKFGPYEILSLLGVGGMGEVYRARDTKLEREVAIKVLPAETASDPDRLRRFEREARAASALNHPNIVTIYEIGEHDGIAYIAMELVEGMTLRALIDAGSIPPERLVRYATQIAEGLAKAHGAGIVHRDLKPENIIISQDDYIKILDFGLAKLAPSSQHEGSEEPTLEKGDTTPGTILGTLAYMSPEQAKGISVDFRSDQFSMGAILHEIATGKSPFRRDTPAETLSSILRDEPEALRDTPSTLASVVARCLKKRSQDRFSSTGDIVEALRSVSRESTPSAARPVPSIAVLPFNNLSPDPDNEYFSDGLTEEIITDLSKVRAMKVISQKSAMRLKGSDKDLRTIGKELRVDYVLQGSVRRAGDNLRVTAQLIDVDNDEHLWAEKYTGTMEDVFAIQEKLSRTIVEALKVQLTSEEDRGIAEKPIDNAQAYDCYLRARHEYSRATREGVEAALRCLDEGLEIVGPNALLYAAKGYAYFNLAIVDTLRHREYLETCREWAEKIFELEPDSARGHGLLGLALADLFETVEGIRHMERAFELDPNDVDNLSWLSIFSAFVGRRERSSSLTALLLERDGLNPFSQLTAGFAHLLTDRLDEAQRCLEKAYAMDPEVPIFRTGYAWILASRERPDEALELLAPFEKAQQSHAWTTLGLTLKYALEGDETRVAELVTEELQAAFRTDLFYAFLLAERYALLGAKELALGWLEVAIEGGFWNFDFLKSDPLLQNLQGEPELTRLVEIAREKSKQLDA